LSDIDVLKAAKASTAFSAVSPVSVDATATSPADFQKQFEIPKLPALIMEGCRDWTMQPGEAWSLPFLSASYGEELFACGARPDDKDDVILIRLESFDGYCRHQADDEPLYIFDATLDASAPELVEAFTVPSVFEHDELARLVEATGDPDARPEWRWLLCGPAR
jgi:hypothetical protein